jgi:hypothetical protein
VWTEVLKLQAKDMDKGYNGLLTFVISGGDEAVGAWDIFNSGNIIMGGGSTDEASLVVAAPLDREEIASYVLNISVWDEGKPPKFTSKLPCFLPFLCGCFFICGIEFAESDCPLAVMQVRLASLKVVVSCTCNQSETMQVFAHQEALFSCAKKVFFGI